MEDKSADIIKSGDVGENWRELLASDYWKQPPNWTQVGAQKKGIWGRIKNIPKEIYEFLVVRISYEDYFASQLRSRYMDLEGRFRNALLGNKDTDISDFIKELLILSKRILEQEKLGKMDLISTSSQLDRAEECIIWILPKDIKISKIHEISLDLDRFEPKIKDFYEKLLQGCQKYLDEPNSQNNSHDNCNANIEEIVRAINKDILEKRINTGLQIERLRSLRFWGLILLIFYVLMYPMLGMFDAYDPYTKVIVFLNTTFAPGTPMGIYNDLKIAIGGWAVALSFCVVGGIGGFLSGLLQVKNSETNLELYEEAVLLFQIRPIFGAFAGLVMFMLISLGSLSSVFSYSPGSMVLAAFLSGFSERYFLKLLKTETEPKDNDKDRGSQQPAAGEQQGQRHNRLSSESAGQASTEQL
jgi:hypothetical protein